MKEIIIPILNNEYKVIVCWGTEKFLKKVLKDWKYPEVTTSLDKRGITYHTYGCHPVIWLPRKPKTSEEIGTLAHEAVHAINHIFDMLSDNFRDTEVFAHSVGAVVRRAMK